jgi:hypothetical protein
MDRREKTKEQLLSMAEQAAVAVLSETLSEANGGFSSLFGPTIYSYLVQIATSGTPDGHCERMGRHLFNPVNRCVICNATKAMSAPTEG